MSVTQFWKKHHRTYIHTYMYTYIPTYIHTPHTYIHIYIPTYIHTPHTYIHTYIHTHTHTHTHTYILTYTVRSRSFRTDFFSIEDTWGRHIPFLFKISSIGIYTGFYAVVHFLKSCRKFLFWNFVNSLVTASWISATSAKWSPFNFIFNLGNRK